MEGIDRSNPHDIHAANFMRSQTESQCLRTKWSWIRLRSIRRFLQLSCRRRSRLDPTREFPITIAVAVLTAIFGWLVWSWIAFALGTTLLRTPQKDGNSGQLLRTSGFATAPGLIAVLGVFRPWAGIAVFTPGLRIVCAFVVSATQALDYRRTVQRCLYMPVAWSVNVTFLVLA
jgi:hypothetical protein